MGPRRCPYGRFSGKGWRCGQVPNLAVNLQDPHPTLSGHRPHQPPLNSSALTPHFFPQPCPALLRVPLVPGAAFLHRADPGQQSECRRTDEGRGGLLAGKGTGSVCFLQKHGGCGLKGWQRKKGFNARIYISNLSPNENSFILSLRNVHCVPDTNYVTPSENDLVLLSCCLYVE